MRARCWPHAAPPADRSRRAGGEEGPVGARDRGAGAQHARAGPSGGGAPKESKASIPTCSACRTSCRRNSAPPCRSSTAAPARARSSSATTRSMSSTASSRTSVSVACAARLLAGCATPLRNLRNAAVPGRFHDTGLGQWHIEAEQPGAHHRRQRRARHRHCPPASPLWFKPRSRARCTSSSTPPPWPRAAPTTRSAISTSSGWPAIPTAAQPCSSPAQRQVRRVQRSADLLRRTGRQPQHHHALPPLHRRSVTPAIAARARSFWPRRPARAESAANHHADRERPGHRIPARRQDACFASKTTRPTRADGSRLRTTSSHLRIERLRISASAATLQQCQKPQEKSGFSC